MDRAAVDVPVVIELELPARPEVVSVARMVIGSLALDDPAFGEERAADLRLAVSEACTNAIQAHLAADDRQPVRVRCHVRPGIIEVVVEDCGGGFDPESMSWPTDLTDPDRLEYEGGLGIPLIRLLADEVEFRPSSLGTAVTMRFGPEGPSGRLDP